VKKTERTPRQTAPKTAKAKPRARKPPKARQQFAALPWRGETAPEVLLVTSRETGRWVIPKGWPIAGKSGWAAAAREAMEEAGVVGEIERAPLGAYPYVKYLKSGRGQACKVKVFPLKVTGQMDDWPEKGQRTSRWFDWAEAAGAVQEIRLARLIRRFAKRRRLQAAPLASTQETSSPSTLPTA
jgi:8-oxo-dGTP pyrophosphatase MutT (NUDIX family)